MLKPDEQLGYLLTQASFLKQRITNAALKELDITYMQFIILAGIFELGDDGELVTQQVISTKRRLDKAMVSNVVKTLIEKELITRDTHPIDKRAYILKLTKQGAEKAAEGKMIAHNIDKEFFSGIDCDVFSQSLRTLLINNNNNDEQ